MAANHVCLKLLNKTDVWVVLWVLLVGWDPILLHLWASSSDVRDKISRGVKHSRFPSNFPQFDLRKRFRILPISSWILRIWWLNPWFNDFWWPKARLQRRTSIQTKIKVGVNIHHYKTHSATSIHPTKQSLLGGGDCQINTVAMEDDARMQCARNVSLKPGFNLALLDGHFCSLLERMAVNAAPEKNWNFSRQLREFLMNDCSLQQINYLHCLHAWVTPYWNHWHGCSPKMLCHDPSTGSN